MPLLKREQVPLVPAPSELAGDASVFAIQYTQEVFLTYTDYIQRIEFYQSRQFQCGVTGKSGLTYLEALRSELSVQKTMASFSEVHIPHIVHCLHHNEKSLNDVVDQINRVLSVTYVPGEVVQVKPSSSEPLQKATIVMVLTGQGRPYSFIPTSSARSVKGGTSVSSGSKDVTMEDASTSNSTSTTTSTTTTTNGDTPYLTCEFGQLLDLTRIQGTPGQYLVEVAGSSGTSRRITVPSAAIVRKKHPAPKSMLRQFIRMNAKKEPYVGSVWTCSPELVERFGLKAELPQSVAEKEAATRKAKRAREEDGEEDAEVEEPEAKKPKIVRKYPIEDTELDPEADRPAPPEGCADFECSADALGSLLLIWDFLQMFGRTLCLSPFTLESLEGALRSHESNLTDEIQIALLRVLQDLSDRGIDEIGEDTWERELKKFVEEEKKDGTFRDINGVVRKLNNLGFNRLSFEDKLEILQLEIEEATESNEIRGEIEKNLKDYEQACSDKWHEDKLIRAQRKAAGEEVASDSDEEGGSASGDSDSEGPVVEPPPGYHEGTLGRREKLEYEKTVREIEAMRRAEKERRVREERRRINAERAQEKEEETNEARRQEAWAQKLDDLRVRTKPLGRDRNHRTYWWFAGEGHGGARVYIEDGANRRWTYYSEVEQVNLLMSSLNTKGVRESALHAVLMKKYTRIVTAMRKHAKEVRDQLAIAASARRSTRLQSVSDKKDYMQYVNKWRKF